MSNDSEVDLDFELKEGELEVEGLEQDAADADNQSTSSISHHNGDEGTLVDEDEEIAETYHHRAVEEIASPGTKVADGGELNLPILEPPSSPKRKKKRDVSSLRKAPQAPKRFKSSYICFFTSKQPEIKEELGDKATVTEISKRSAQMWKTLATEDRAYWDDVAAKDKQRYIVEKASYTGPWQIPFKRAKKDPTAPKRPMSAFLHFSQGKRSKIKEEMSGIKNTEVSRLLGEMWRNCSDEERKPYVDKEKVERGVYKIAMAEWKVEHEKRKEEEHKIELQQRQERQQQLEEAHQLALQRQQYMAAHQGVDTGSGQHVQQYPQAMQYMPPQGYSPYPPPQMYPHYSPYPPQPGSYQQYPGRKAQPVILGPNGLPHHYQMGQHPQQPPPYMYQHYLPHGNNYEDPHTPIPVTGAVAYDSMSAGHLAPSEAQPAE